MSFDFLESAKSFVPGHGQHHGAGEQIIEGLKTAHEVVGGGVLGAEVLTHKAPLPGLHKMAKGMAPLDVAFGVYDIYKGLKEGGPEGTLDVIGGGISVANGALAGTPLGAVTGALGLGFNFGRSIDKALGLSDKISESTSGRGALMEKQGTRFIPADQRGAQNLGKVGTSYQEMIHNSIYKNQMLLDGKVWDPAAGNYVPRAPHAQAQAEPFGHFAD